MKPGPRAIDLGQKLAGSLLLNKFKEQYAWYSRLPELGLFLKRLKAKYPLE